MGSCSIKVVDKNDAIKTEIVKLHKDVCYNIKVITPEESKVPMETQPQASPVININNSKPSEDSVFRKSRKNLTVSAVNSDNLNLPQELFDGSLIKLMSEGKHDQGSILSVNNPITVGGKPCQNIQTNFEEKLIEIQGDNVKRDFLNDHGLWVCCKKGMKPEIPNQDDFVIILDSDSLLLGVFDGHGTHGHDISNYVHNEFPRLLYSHKNWEDDPLEAYKETFLRIQDELVAFCNKQSTRFDCILSGSTATLVKVTENSVYVGHVGDSRCILGKRESGRIIAKDLTRDHKPCMEDEKARIESVGGEVKIVENGLPARVFVKEKYYPGIAMSRAIGDTLAHTVGVCSIPEVLKIDIGEEDELIVICSDGVWEFIESQTAVEQILRFEDPKSSAEALAQLAWDKWVLNEGDIVDDITVIVLFIKRMKFV